MWEDRLAFLTESLPVATVPPHVWVHIERQIRRERVVFSRPTLQLAVGGALSLAVVALLVLVLG
jgi:hypothetical protein